MKKKCICDIIVAIIVMACLVFIANSKLIVISCIIDHNYFNRVVFEQPCYGRCGDRKISIIQVLEYYINHGSSSIFTFINAKEIIMYLILGKILIIFVILYILFIRKMSFRKGLIFLLLNILVCTIVFVNCFCIFDKPIDKPIDKPNREITISQDGVLRVPYEANSFERNERIEFCEDIEEYVKNEYKFYEKVNRINASCSNSRQSLSIIFESDKNILYMYSRAEFPGRDLFVNLKDMDIMFNREAYVNFSEGIEKYIENKYDFEVRVEKIKKIACSDGSDNKEIGYCIYFIDGSSFFLGKLFDDIEDVEIINVDNMKNVHCILTVPRERSVEYSEKIEQYINQKYDMDVRIEKIEIIEGDNGIEYHFDFNTWRILDAILYSSSYKLFDLDSLKTGEDMISISTRNNVYEMKSFIIE